MELLSSYAYGIWGMRDALPFFFLAGLGTALYLNGRKTKKLLSRFRFYQRFMVGRDYISLRELSDLTGRKVDFLRQDLYKMLERKLFLQGRMNEDETGIFLTEEGYRMFCEDNEGNTASHEGRDRNEKKNTAKKVENRRQRVRDLWKDKVQEIKLDGKNKMQEAGETLKSKLQEREGEKTDAAAIREGEETNQREVDFKTMAAEYLVFYEKTQKRIRSGRVQRIVTDFGVYTVRIMSYEIEEEARTKFFQYYLPLTKKLLFSYEEMEQGKMEEKAHDLEDLLNTIRYSFETFADKLAEGKGMDVETDILALDSMLNIE